MAETITGFDQLLSATAKQHGQTLPLRAAVVLPDAPAVLQAVRRTMAQGLIKPFLLIDRATLAKSTAGSGMCPDEFDIIPSESPEDAVTMGAKMALDHKADLLVFGTDENFAAVSYLARPENGFVSAKGLLGHVGLLEHRKYPRLLLLTDSFVHPIPDINQKIGLIQNAAAVARALGVGVPKVAVLAAVEVVYPGMIATTDGAILAKMSDRRQIPGCTVDGPLSMDCATVMEVARDKGVVSEVAGAADILLAPDMETANSTYKAMSMVVRAGAAGVIVGGWVPVAFPARCDSSDNIFNSILAAVFLACRNKNWS